MDYNTRVALFVPDDCIQMCSKTFKSCTIDIAIYSVIWHFSDTRVISATINVIYTDIPQNNMLHICLCRIFIAAAESAGILSVSFANFNFAPHFFGSTLNGAHSVFLGLGCWNLRKFFCMYPGMDMYMFYLFYYQLKVNIQYILPSQSMAIF